MPPRRSWKRLAPRSRSSRHRGGFTLGGALPGVNQALTTPPVAARVAPQLKSDATVIGASKRR